MFEDIVTSGMYRITWFNEAGQEVKSYDKYLTIPEYRREYMKMQTAFLRGEDVYRMTATPIN